MNARTFRGSFGRPLAIAALLAGVGAGCMTSSPPDPGRPPDAVVAAGVQFRIASVKCTVASAGAPAAASASVPVLGNGPRVGPPFRGAKGNDRLDGEAPRLELAADIDRRTAADLAAEFRQPEAGPAPVAASGPVPGEQISCDVTRQILSDYARARYPGLFTPSRLAIPIALTIVAIPPRDPKCYWERGAVLTVGVPDESVPAGLRTRTERLDFWATQALLALLPARAIDAVQGPHATPAYQMMALAAPPMRTTAACVREGSREAGCAVLMRAIWRALQSFGPDELRQSCAAWRGRYRPVTLDGKPAWVGGGRERSGDGHEGYGVELFWEDPATGAEPFEMQVVARRPAGCPWEAMPAFLEVGPSLVRVAAAFEGGVPVRAEVGEVRAPELSELLVVRESDVRQARLRNRALTYAKNHTLPGWLKERGAGDVQDLATRIEGVAMDLTHEAEMAKNRAQLALELNQGDPTPQREFSLVYRERVALLASILEALKSELAARRQ